MQDIPYGYCWCGCGNKTKIAAKTNAAQGQVKGQPNRFLAGHKPAKHPDYLPEDRGYTTPCWIWRGAKDRDGYGLVRRDQRRLTTAHGWYYRKTHGPIPVDCELDHLCRVRDCVNPDHLEPVPHGENVRRGRSPKLSPEAVHEIRNAPRTYGSAVALARKFGVHPGYVSQVRSGRSRSPE